MSMMSLYEPQTPRDLAQWTARIYRQYWPQWMVLALLTLVPVVLFSLGLSMVVPQPELDPAVAATVDDLLNSDPATLNSLALTDEQINALITYYRDLIGPTLLVTGLGVIVQFLLVTLVIRGVGTAVASAAYQGRRTTLQEALQIMLPRAGLLLGGSLLVAAVLVVLFVASAAGIAICVGILGFGLVVYLYLGWLPLLTPALVLDDRRGLWPMVRRAWLVGKQRVWVTLTATLTLFAAQYVLTFAVSIPFSTLMGDSVLGGVLTNVIVQAIILPFGVIFFTLLYEDTRARLDAAAAAITGDVPGQPGDTPGQSGDMLDKLPFFSAADLSTMIGVGLIGLAIFGLLYMATLTSMLF